MLRAKEEAGEARGQGWRWGLWLWSWAEAGSGGLGAGAVPRQAGYKCKGPGAGTGEARRVPPAPAAVGNQRHREERDRRRPGATPPPARVRGQPPLPGPVPLVNPRPGLHGHLITPSGPPSGLANGVAAPEGRGPRQGLAWALCPHLRDQLPGSEAPAPKGAVLGPRLALEAGPPPAGRAWAAVGRGAPRTAPSTAALGEDGPQEPLEPGVACMVGRSQGT